MDKFLGLTVVFGFFGFVALFCYIAANARKWMPIPMNNPAVQVYTSVLGSSDTLKVQMSETLLVFRTYEATRKSLVGRWINAETTTFFNGMIGYRFKEVIIMPYETDSKYEQAVIDAWIKETAPTLLKSGGTLINMNDPGPEDRKDENQQGT